MNKTLPDLTIKLLTLSWITSNRQLIHDNTVSRNSWSAIYDFVIVGAGTAGSTLAHRLAQRGDLKVLLLEAGGAQSAIYNDIPGLYSEIGEYKPDLEWSYYNEPQHKVGLEFSGGRIPLPMGKTLGGSSTNNALIFNRGNRRDYDNWVKTYGAHGWSFNEVLPFFTRFENNTDRKIVDANPKYHGYNGPVEVSSLREPPKLMIILHNIYRNLGFNWTDFNGPKQSGSMIMQSFITNRGLRASNSNAYVDPNPFPHNLHIVSRALVVKVVFTGSTAIGVEFTRNNRVYCVLARKEVILSAGAVNTPQLLMLSGIGPESHLQQFGIPVVKDLPVGNNYMNHPNVDIASKILNPKFYYPLARLDAQSLSELYFHSRGRLSENPNGGLYYNTASNEDKEWSNSLLYDSVTNDTLLLNLNIVRTRSRGTIRLQSNSPYIPPLIDPNIFNDSNDYEQAVDSLRIAFFILEKSSIAEYVKPPTFESIGCPSCPGKHRYECIEGIKCFIGYNSFVSHPSGSCRMGDIRRDDVVVGPDLRVKHMKNLRVCDASVIPELPNSNTNSAVNMIGEKCAQIINDHLNN